MQPFYFCVALGPLAAYFFLLGIVNWSRRPLLVSGFRETAALGLALSGFAVVGPMQLFMPEPAAVYFGSLVWALLLGLYGLMLILVILLSKPRLVIFNFRISQLRPILSEVRAEARQPGPLGRRQPGTAAIGRATAHRGFSVDAQYLARLDGRGSGFWRLATIGTGAAGRVAGVRSFSQSAGTDFGDLQPDYAGGHRAENAGKPASPGRGLFEMLRL